MSDSRRISLGLSIAAGVCIFAAAPCLAQTRTEIDAASAAPLLDLSSQPTEAIHAAKAAQAAKTAPATSGDTVEPVTVHPETQPQGRVVASTDAASLTSPNYSAKDNQEPVLAVGAGRNRALGAQKVDNTFAEGFLKVNPQGGATRTDVGVTNLFSTR